MELILIIVVAYGLVMLVGGIIWESKTPEEKKEMEEKWERERIQRRANRRAAWNDFLRSKAKGPCDRYRKPQ